MDILLLWKGRRVYEAKRTAHRCVEACDYSYLTVWQEVVLIWRNRWWCLVWCPKTRGDTRRNAPELSLTDDLRSGDHLPHHIINNADSNDKYIFFVLRFFRPDMLPAYYLKRYIRYLEYVLNLAAKVLFSARILTRLKWKSKLIVVSTVWKLSYNYGEKKELLGSYITSSCRFDILYNAESSFYR